MARANAPAQQMPRVARESSIRRNQVTGSSHPTHHDRQCSAASPAWRHQRRARGIDRSGGKCSRRYAARRRCLRGDGIPAWSSRSAVAASTRLQILPGKRAVAKTACCRACSRRRRPYTGSDVLDPAEHGQIRTSRCGERGLPGRRVRADAPAATCTPRARDGPAGVHQASSKEQRGVSRGSAMRPRRSRGAAARTMARCDGAVVVGTNDVPVLASGDGHPRCRGRIVPRASGTNTTPSKSRDTVMCRATRGADEDGSAAGSRPSCAGCRGGTRRSCASRSGPMTC